MEVPGGMRIGLKDNGGVVTDATVSQEDPQTPPSKLYISKTMLF